MKIKFTTIIGILSLIFPVLILVLRFGNIDLNAVEFLGMHFDFSEDNTQKERDNSLDEIYINTNVNNSDETQISKSQNENCWETIWSFSPKTQEDINNQLQPIRSSYYQAFFDSSDTPNPNIKGSIKIVTDKKVENLIEDPYSWSWIYNFDLIPADDAEYRLIGWMKTKNTRESHISIVARDSFSQDIYINSTNQISKIPFGTRNGSSTWTEYISTEFNPLLWSKESQVIMIGLNAGPSFEDGEGITWFTELELQKCNR